MDVGRALSLAFGTAFAHFSAHSKLASVWGVLVGVGLLGILPVLVSHNPPLHDYPFHIARMHILISLRHSPTLEQYYTITSFMLPNIAMDVAIPFLAHLMPTEMAGRLFLCLTLLLQISGCLVLYRVVHGRFSRWPLVSSFFVYNWIFVFGFLNYLVGIGLLLWSTAAWIWLSSRPVTARWAFGSILAILLFFCHLIVVGLFAVVIAGWEVPRILEDRKTEPHKAMLELAVSASIFVVPAVMYFFSSTEAAPAGASHKLINLLRLPAIFIRVMCSADWAPDILLFTTMAVFAGILSYAGQIVLVRSMRIVIGLLFLTYVLIPHELSGGWGVDSRIPVLITFVVIASTRVTLGEVWRGFAFCLLFVALIARTALFAYDWHSYDSVYIAFRDAFAKLPSDSLLYVASEDAIPSMQDLNLRLWQPPLEHVATLAVFDHDTFVPQTWARYGQQPISFTPRFQPVAEFQTNGPLRIETAEELRSAIERARALVPSHMHPYLLLLYPSYRHLILPADCRIVDSSARFLLLGL
jgi:hypothetical protein